MDPKMKLYEAQMMIEQRKKLLAEKQQNEKLKKQEAKAKAVKKEAAPPAVTKPQSAAPSKGSPSQKEIAPSKNSKEEKKAISETKVETKHDAIQKIYKDMPIASVEEIAPTLMKPGTAVEELKSGSTDSFHENKTESVLPAAEIHKIEEYPPPKADTAKSPSTDAGVASSIATDQIQTLVANPEVPAAVTAAEEERAVVPNSAAPIAPALVHEPIPSATPVQKPIGPIEDSPAKVSPPQQILEAVKESSALPSEFSGTIPPPEVPTPPLTAMQEILITSSEITEISSEQPESSSVSISNQSANKMVNFSYGQSLDSVTP